MKISFVIPTRNCVTFLPHAVTTALNQSHSNIEVIVVDDDSTDKTGEYLDWLSKTESRVKVVKPGINIGRSAARNLGNQTAQGEILLVLDADDLATPNRAELTIRKFNKCNADYIYGAATIIDALGNPHAVIGSDVFNLDSLKNEANGIVHSTAAYRKAYADRFPYRTGEISDLGLDDYANQREGLIGGAVFDFVPHRLACYRNLSGQISRIRDKEAVKAAKAKFMESLKVAA